ncbi:sodium-coupled monocarboxylate transporter 2-like isoform X2 [Ostrea edulis]|uniref:sodium-coupled monocarboxylate transporter 2-like isoform X2 n=1 Tax=Ostrea edulis TaxID=37623 RepID=UPI0024AFD1DC|nr:sodium-coupled monocarboxylate transporter 2-like isoform X2 [Ostrea edulis]
MPIANNNFAVADWIIFAGSLFLSGCIGIFCGGKQRTTKDFLMGNRELKTLPVAVSILMSFFSAILILGAPAEMYTNGTQYYIYVFGQMAAAAFGAILFVPLFYPLKLTSVFEYVELRFKSRATRLTVTAINAFTTIIHTGVTSFAPSTALQAVSGFPEWASFLLIGCVCTFYTFLGGLKAVVLVNVFQFIVMFGSLLAIIVTATAEVGGFGNVWELNDEWGRIDFWNFDVDPTIRHTFWALTVGGMLSWIGSFGASQQSIQRFSALPSLRQAKLAVLLNCVGVCVMVTCACVAGISVFAYYVMKGCDPYTNKDIQNTNQIIPNFVMEKLNFHGVRGLFFAALFSGALSKISANLSSLVTTMWEDVIKPHVHKKSDVVQMRITRCLVLLFGAIGVGASFVVRSLDGTVLQVSLSFMGTASGALNGFIVLGAFFPCCNWIGAIVGPIVSYAVMMWISIAKYSVIGVEEKLDFPALNCTVKNASRSLVTNKITPYLMTSEINMITTVNSHIPMATDELSGLDRLYSLSYLWYATLGLIISVVVGLVASFITSPTKPEDVDPAYLIPWCDRLCCYLPSSLRTYCHSGVEHGSQESVLSIRYTKSLEENKRNEPHVFVLSNDNNINDQRQSMDAN